jgi:hypothetical protein
MRLGFLYDGIVILMGGYMSVSELFMVYLRGTFEFFIAELGLYVDNLLELFAVNDF